MRLVLFGLPHLQTADGRTLGLPWNRPAALLAVLACRPEGIGRDALATLLRPDDDAAGARAHLRRQLHRARALLPEGAPWPAEERQLRWSGSSDVAEFLAAAAHGDWAGAVALQRLPLLAGTGRLGDAALDGWIDAERERLAARLRVALCARLDVAATTAAASAATTAATSADAAPDDAECARLIERLVDLDPLDETLLQAALERAHGPLARAAALAACGTAFDRLRDEPGRAPTAATRRLFDSVAAAVPARHAARPAGVTDAADATEAADATAAPAPARPFAWVDSAAPLVGREAEISALLERLQGGGARLLALLGLGGVGKTRLALALSAAWPGDVVRVDLAAAQAGERWVAQVAEAAGLTLAGEAAAEQWLDWLAARAVAPPLLLLLDNVEGLVGDPLLATLLPRWLDAAPALRVLLTSRSAPGLPGELRHEVRGLDVQGAAQRLLEHHAARLGVPLREDDLPGLARIASMLQGHPLGLELAASWLPLMPPREIAAELARAPAFLADEEAANPAQRSLRVVFARSWQWLDASAQALLAALTVFAGSFDLDAARAVAGGTPRALLRLVSQSMLQRAAPGRFELHPVLRHFAARELPAPREAALRTAHAEHYVAQLKALGGVGLGRLEPATRAWLQAEARQLAAAWRWAVQAARWDLIDALHERLADFMTAPSRVATMLPLWDAAAEALQAGPTPAHPLRARLDLARAAARANLGRHAESEALLEAVGPRLADEAERSIWCTARSVVAWWRGDMAQVDHFTAEALRAAERAGQPLLQARAEQNLAVRAWAQERRADAEVHVLRMLALAEAEGANLLRARALRQLSVLRSEQGRHDEAAALLDASTAGYAAAGETLDVARNLCDLSHFERRRGARARQLELAGRALAITARAGVPGEHLYALTTLGIAERDAGRLDAAAPLLVQAVALALRLKHARGLQRAFAQLMLTRLPAPEALRGLAAVLAASRLRDEDRAEVERAFEAALPEPAARAALLRESGAVPLQALAALAVAGAA